MPMRRTALALVLYAIASLAHAGLPATLAGAWYNPAQSGHGISVEFVGSSRAIVVWHVYDPAGRPLTLYLDGRVNGRSVSGPVYAPEGMRFGSFDSAAVQLPIWGSASVVFSHCDQAELLWQGNDPAYGTGQITLVPQVPKTGECALPPPNALPSGLISGVTEPLPGQGPATRLHGLVDGEGRLWGIQREVIGGGQMEIPGPAWLANSWPMVVRAIPYEVAGSSIAVQSSVFGIFAFSNTAARAHYGSTGAWGLADGSAQLRLLRAVATPVESQVWTLAPPVGVTKVLPLDMATLAGEWTLSLRSQFFTLDYPLLVAADGSLHMTLAEGELGIAFSGRLELTDGAQGIIDFELVDTTRRHVLPYRGRGWLADTPTGRELVLIGDNGSNGLAVIARPN